MTLGRLAPGNAQYFQSSGESTPQAQLPEQFVSNPVASSPISDHLSVAYESYHDIRRAPIVSRVERTVGMRTLYNRGMSRMPIRRLGADGQPIPWNSSMQPLNEGPIRNCHFNDALFQAGYPGFNLALSFKVPTLNTTQGGGRSADYTPANINVSKTPSILRRATRGTG
jgi:hypothetical protein